MSPGAEELYVTIGHSTLTVADLIILLHEAGSDLVADVRSIPRSTANPQFNQDTLPVALAAEGIGYQHLSLLGGLRGRRKSAHLRRIPSGRTKAFVTTPTTP
jgi:uncharacterized protein (DUF488 family)